MIACCIRLRRPSAGAKLSLGETPINPIDQIAGRYIANKQKQRIGKLIEIAVAKLMGRQRTGLH